MSKSISNGIEQLVGERSTPTQKQLDQHEKAWRALRNRLDSILVGTNVIKGDDIRARCHSLDGLGQSDRYNHILAHWGKLYADRSTPILQQLDVLEKEISKLRNLK